MGFFDDIGGFLGKVAPLFGTLAPGVLDTLGIGGGRGGAIPPMLAPPLPADATDEQIRQSVLMQRRKLLLGQGQASTFVTGPMGDPSPFATSKSSAGGF